jgi:hypothetical protein
MGKFVNSDVLDSALNAVAGATRMVALNGQPATFAVAEAGKLAEVTLTGADFTLAAGDISGRKVSVAGKTGLGVIAAGTADHVALLDPVTSKLLYVTTCPVQALALGGTVGIAGWAIEIGAPA